jgi:hypothetical protein
MKLSLLMLIVTLPLMVLQAQHKQQIQLSAGWLNSTDSHEGVSLSVGYERNLGKRFTIEGVYSNIMQMRGGWIGLQNIVPSKMFYTKPSTGSDAYPFEDRVPSNERNRKGIINEFERSNDDALHTVSGFVGYTIIDKPKHRLQLKSGALVGYGSFVDSDESGESIFTLSEPNAQPMPIFFESDLYSRNLFWGWHIYSVDYQYHIKKSISIGLRHSLTYFNNIWIQDLINYQISLSKHF